MNPLPGAVCSFGAASGRFAVETHPVSKCIAPVNVARFNLAYAA
jgi:hypothetical protein